MHDPLNAGRRLAARVVLWQAGATALVALAFLPLGTAHALAAGLGGGAIALGMLLSARIALAGGVQPAGLAMGRLLAGLVAKWFVVAVVLAIGLAALHLPPLPLLLGLVVASLSYVLANLFKR